MALKQRISLAIKNKTTTELKIQKAQIEYGRFHAPNDISNEIPRSQVEGQSIPAGGSFTINSSGREDAAIGTEGTVYITADGSEIVKVYWNVPWGAYVNELTPTVVSDSYSVNVPEDVPQDGPIGNISVEISDA
ncbi:hypothetical protein TWF730_000413 [Orbilia blumenaviensis]|uniref:Uncharacterized protein n=1 Tax=Orbilia blumenaviensis TaxID=1796055 RepID=A0AAV9VP92_9PEZI